MSAVAAILSLDGSAPHAGETGAMAGELRAFGSDRQWQWQPGDQPVALFRALDELTPSDRHAAGVASAGDWVLVGDVRLDAREDLARALALDARAAQGCCDEQLVALALARWGPSAIERLEGGFALIAWNRSSRELHLWRDSNGERPLYFCRTPRRLIVASRAPILLAAEGVPRALDVAGLVNYLAAGQAPARTSLAGIDALGRGVHHRFAADASQGSRIFWQPPDPWQWTRERIDDPVGRCRSIFATVVRDALRLLGAKGGFCSGGPRLHIDRRGGGRRARPRWGGLSQLYLGTASRLARAAQRAALGE